MTPEERQLIAGLFDRMRDYRLPEKDSEAEALINERVRSVPDASYMLVQSVLVQEQALEEAGSRIKALEDQARALQSGTPERPQGSGGFMGGWLGNRAAPEQRSGSVPQIGARATPSTYDSRQPWMPPQGAPQAAPAAQAAASGGGGFLRTAMATAAGVAGGMLVAGAIRDMMGGNNAQANAAGANAPAAANQPQDAAASASETAQPAPTQDVADDGGGWFGGELRRFRDLTLGGPSEDPVRPQSRPTAVVASSRPFPAALEGLQRLARRGGGAGSHQNSARQWLRQAA